MKNQLELLEAIVDQLPGGIIVVDPNGYIIFANKGYQDYLRKKKEEIINKHISEVLPHSRLPIVITTKAPEYGTWQKQGDHYQARHRVPLYDKNGCLIGAIGQLILHNPDGFGQLAERLMQTETKLEYYQQELTSIIDSKFTFKSIIGQSAEIKSAKSIARKVAPLAATVLIRGETGVGKEVFAHAIHMASMRSNKPFIKINCSAIPSELLESELFGYEEGAFTGARKKGKPGKFQLADQGTIFLDEIGDMPLNMQPKILGVIQDKEIERLGATRPIKVDVRIIAATNKNLEELVSQEKFRSDLFYRLNVIPLVIPPLRERKEDIRLLTKYYLAEMAKRLGRKPTVIKSEVMNILCNYDWPGNIRELFNILERMLFLHEGNELELIDLPQYILTNERIEKNIPPISLEKGLQLSEKEILLQALQQAAGNKTLAAKLLGIHRVTLHKKIKYYFEKERT